MKTMPAKKYRVKLTAEERDELQRLVDTGKVAALKRKHAQILLHADESELGLGWDDNQIAKANGVHRGTVERIRQRLVEHGLESALNRAPRTRHKARKLDGQGEAHLVALVCSEPPEGRCRWTLQLLADRLVSLGQVDEISIETVRQALKKTNLSLGSHANGVSHRKRMPSLSARWKMS